MRKADAGNRADRQIDGADRRAGVGIEPMHHPPRLALGQHTRRINGHRLVDIEHRVARHAGAHRVAAMAGKNLGTGNVNQRLHRRFGRCPVSVRRQRAGYRVRQPDHHRRQILRRNRRHLASIEQDILLDCRRVVIDALKRAGHRAAHGAHGGNAARAGHGDLVRLFGLLRVVERHHRRKPKAELPVGQGVRQPGAGRRAACAGDHLRRGRQRDPAHRHDGAARCLDSRLDGRPLQKGVAVAYPIDKAGRVERQVVVIDLVALRLDAREAITEIDLDQVGQGAALSHINR